MLIILDTNILPRYGKLHTVAMTTLFRVATALEAKLAITRTVFAESVNARREDAQEAVDKFGRAAAQLAKYYPIEQIYVPPAGVVANEWGEQLESAFEVLDLEGEDAIEAIEREAMRIKPAKADGTGARDSAIWLCVKRIHLLRKTHTYFVSNNTEDFAARRGSSFLHADLLAEIGDSVDTFHYHTSIDSVINALCVRSDVVLTSDSFLEEALIAVVEQVAGHRDLNNFESFSGRGPDEFGPVESIRLTDVNVRDSYETAGVTVGFLSAHFSMSLASDAHDILGTSIVGRLGGWFERQGDSEKVSKIDVTLIKEISYVRPWESVEGTGVEGE